MWHRIIVPKGHAMAPDLKMLESYLPSNFKVMAEQSDRFVVEGRDRLGWTAKGYVLPRLGSGLIPAHVEASVEYPLSPECKLPLEWQK